MVAYFVFYITIKKNPITTYLYDTKIAIYTIYTYIKKKQERGLRINISV